MSLFLRNLVILGLVLLQSGAVHAAIATQDTLSGVWSDVANRARSPLLSSEERLRVAEKVHGYLRDEVAARLKRKPEDLRDLFAREPELIEKLKLRSDEGLGQVYTEYSHLLNFVQAEKALKGCEGRRGLQQDVLSGAATYSACNEGGYSQKQFVWRNDTPGGEPLSAPVFVIDPQSIGLIEKAHDFSSQLQYAPQLPLRPKIEALREANPQVKKSLAPVLDRVNLRADMYRRTIQNAVLNRITAQYQYSKVKPTGAEILEEIRTAAKEYCEHCGPEDLESIISRVAHQTQTNVKRGELKWRPAEEWAESLCQKVRQTGYDFYGAHLDTSSVLSNLGGKQQAKNEVIWRNRSRSLRAVIREGSEGLLLMTDAVVDMRSQEPGHLKLRCHGESSATDHNRARIGAALTEVVDSTREYVKRVNEKMHTGPATVADVSKDIHELLKTNPRAAGEVLESYPSLSGIICEAIGSIEEDDYWKEKGEKALIWGSLVTGTALMATGILAPVVATVTVAGSTVGVSFLALAAGTAVSAGSGVYEYHLAGTRREMSELLREQAVAQGGNYKSYEESIQQAKEYEEMKLNAMINLSMSAADVFLLTRGIMRAGRLTLNESQARVRQLAQEREIFGEIPACAP